MNHGCGGNCLGQPVQDQQLETTRDKAKQDAVKSNQTMAIYKEGSEYKYCEAGFAYSNGYPVIEVVSKYK